MKIRDQMQHKSPYVLWRPLVNTSDLRMRKTQDQMQHKSPYMLWRHVVFIKS